MRRFWMVRVDLVIMVGLACLLVGCLKPAHAQSGEWNHGHHELHEDFYKQLKQADNGYSCCNAMKQNSEGTWEGDCRPVRWYEGDNGIFYVFLSGKWQPVPPNKVNTDETPDGYGHVCAHRYTDMIYCFIKGKVFR